jgi:hypothetical protein
MAKALTAPGGFDDTMYHLPEARYYVEHHGIVLDEFSRFPLFPQNMELLFSAGLMFGGVVLAQSISTVTLFIISLGLIGAAEHFAESPVPGYLAVIILLSIQATATGLGLAYIDNGFALFCFAGALASALAISNGGVSWEWILLSGALVGIAAGCKLFGLIFAAILFISTLVIRPSFKQIYFLIGAVVFGAWWYARSFALSGDPFWPAGGPIFGFYIWDAGDLAFQKAELASHGVIKAVRYMPSGLRSAHLLWWLPAFLPLFLFFRRKAAVALLYLVLVIFYTFWFFTTQIDRYLAPVFGVASLLSAMVVFRFILQPAMVRVERLLKWRLGRRIEAWASCAVIATGLVIAAAIASSNIRNWDETEHSRPGEVLFREARIAAPKYGSTLAQLGFENAIFFFDGTVIGDWVGPGRYRQMIDCPNSDRSGCSLISSVRMKAILTRFHSKMLAVNTRVFHIDLKEYSSLFVVMKTSNDGILLALK